MPWAQNLLATQCLIDLKDKFLYILDIEQIALIFEEYKSNQSLFQRVFDSNIKEAVSPHPHR